MTGQSLKQVEQYLKVRQAEGRLYTDEIAARLPTIPLSHPFANEWRQRAGSSKRLIHYLERLSHPLSILDLGCGNGWLSACMASVPFARIWGLDRNGPELAQAARLFTRNNLMFLEADIPTIPFPPQSFDIIILASVIQYFPDLAALLASLRPLLKQGGEIHLLDTPLYKPEEIPAARQRTRSYYASLGFPEMAEHYFHHSFTSIQGFNLRWLYCPDGLFSRLARRFGGSVSPFPWVSLR